MHVAVCQPGIPALALLLQVAERLTQKAGQAVRQEASRLSCQLVGRDVVPHHLASALATMMAPVPDRTHCPGQHPYGWQPPFPP